MLTQSRPGRCDMSSRFNQGGASAPSAMIAAAVLSLPRDQLADLVAVAIERLDEIDGDSDFEPEQDRCAAGEDMMLAGPASIGWGHELNAWTPTEDDEGNDMMSDRHGRTREIRARACYQADLRCARWRFHSEPVAPSERQLLLRHRGMPRRRWI